MTKFGVLEKPDVSGYDVKLTPEELKPFETSARPLLEKFANFHSLTYEQMDNLSRRVGQYEFAAIMFVLRPAVKNKFIKSLREILNDRIYQYIQDLDDLKGDYATYKSPLSKNQVEAVLKRYADDARSYLGMYSLIHLQEGEILNLFTTLRSTMKYGDRVAGENYRAAVERGKSR